MPRHSSWAMRQNAVRGAIKMWCPACKRKAALRTNGYCRYCAVRFVGSQAEHRQLYKKWEANHV